MLPARLHKPLDQGGCCPRAHTRFLASPSPLDTSFPLILNTCPARTNLFPPPRVHTRLRARITPRPTRRQITGTQIHTPPVYPRRSPCCSPPHPPHKHTSLPSWVLEQTCGLKFPSRAEGNRWGRDIQREVWVFICVLEDAFLRNWREAWASSFTRLKYASVSGRKSEGREGNRGFKLGYSETFMYVHLYLQIQRDLPTEGKADANWGLEISFQGGGKRGYEGTVQKLGYIIHSLHKWLGK